MRFHLDDLDWALGELLQLIATARLFRTTPLALDRSLFLECLAVVNAQHLQTRLHIYQILNCDQYGERRTPNGNIRVRPSGKATTHESGSVTPTCASGNDSGSEDRQTMGVSP